MFINNNFQKEDIIKLTEDIYSEIYDLTFVDGTELMVIDFDDNGFHLIDRSGLIVKDVSKDIMELVSARGNYRSNGWDRFTHTFF